MYFFGYLLYFNGFLVIKFPIDSVFIFEKGRSCPFISIGILGV